MAVSRFNEAVSGELFSLTAAQAALFVLTSAVTPPPQTSLGPESSCVPGFWYYDTIGILQLVVAFTIFVFAFVTYKLKRQLATIAGDGPPPPPTRRQRAYALLALLLSLAATVIWAVMAILVMQDWTRRFSCYSAVTQAICCIFMLIMGGLGAMCYTDLVKVFSWSL